MASAPRERAQQGSCGHQPSAAESRAQRRRGVSGVSPDTNQVISKNPHRPPPSAHLSRMVLPTLSTKPSSQRCTLNSLPQSQRYLVRRSDRVIVSKVNLGSMSCSNVEGPWLWKKSPTTDFSAQLSRTKETIERCRKIRLWWEGGGGTLCGLLGGKRLDGLGLRRRGLR